MTFKYLLNWVGLLTISNGYDTEFAQSAHIQIQSRLQDSAERCRANTLAGVDRCRNSLSVNQPCSLHLVINLRLIG